MYIVEDKNVTTRDNFVIYILWDILTQTHK